MLYQRQHACKLLLIHGVRLPSVHDLLHAYLVDTDASSGLDQPCHLQCLFELKSGLTQGYGLDFFGVGQRAHLLLVNLVGNPTLFNRTQK